MDNLLSIVSSTDCWRLHNHNVCDACILRARAHWPLCLATCGRVFVAGIFISVGNHYFQALASTLQFVAQVCDRLWLVPATDRAFAYITYMWPPHVALVCSGPPQCAATCGWTKWPVCSGHNYCSNASVLVNFWFAQRSLTAI